MQARITNNRPIFVESWYPDSEGFYNAEFSFDPNSIAMANGDNLVLFRGFSMTSDVFLIFLGYSSNQYTLDLYVLDDLGKLSSGGAFPIQNSPHTLELNWTAASNAGANNGSVSFTVDSSPRFTLSGLDNDTQRIDRVSLGRGRGY